MRTKLVLCLLCLITIVYTACKKEQSIEPLLGQSAPFNITDYTRLKQFTWEGALLISNFYRQAPGYKDGEDWHRGEASLSAIVYKDPANYGTVEVNGISIPFQNRAAQWQPNSEIVWDKTDSRSDAIFGNNVNISAFGIVGKMYIPKKLLMLYPKPDNVNQEWLKINKADDLIIRWNPDEKSRGILLEVKAQGISSFRIFRDLKDDGETRIRASELASLPVGTQITVSLLRGNYELSADNKFLVMATSSVESLFNIID